MFMCNMYVIYINVSRINYNLSYDLTHPIIIQIQVGIERHLMTHHILHHTILQTWYLCNCITFPGVSVRCSVGL